MTTNPDEQPSTGAREGRDPLKRIIAATLATFVVLGAFLAILNTEASVNELNTARETTRTAVRAMRANVAVGTVVWATEMDPITMDVGIEFLEIDPSVLRLIEELANEATLQ